MDNSKNLMKDVKNKKIELTPLDMLSTIGYDIPRDTARTIGQNNNVTELFPDIEMGANILISSILSPKDGVNINLRYRCINTELNPTIVDIVLSGIEKQIHNHYNLTERLYNIVKKSIYSEGSYIIAYIPPKYIVNLYEEGLMTQESLESGTLVKNERIVDTNIIGTTYNVKVADDAGYKSLVSKINSTIKVSDNAYHLRLNELYGNKKTNTTKVAYGMTQESLETTDDRLDSKILSILLNTEDKLSAANVVGLTNKPDSNSKHRPIEKVLPLESVIPIYVSDDYTKITGYVVMLDHEYRPMRIDKLEKADETFGSSVYNDKTEVGMNNTVHDTNRENLRAMQSKTPTVSNMEDIGKAIIYNKIVSAINTADSDVDINSLDISNSILDMLLTRTLEKRKTTILYLPTELVVNYTYDYKENGLGRPLLDKILVLTSMRSSLLISRVLATINNSIPRTKINCNIPDSDKQPKETVRKVVAAALASQGNTNSMFISTLGGLSDWASQVGLSFNFTGQGVPDFTVEREDVTTRIDVPDDSLEESYRKQTARIYSLTPDMIDGGFNGQTATSILLSDIMFNRRVSQEQIKTNSLITDHVNTIVNTDGILTDNVLDDIVSHMDIIKDSLSEESIESLESDSVSDLDLAKIIYKEISGKVEVSLPVVSKDITEEDSAYDDEVNRIETVLEDLLSDGIAKGTDVEDDIESIKEMVKSVALRKWIAENNYVPGLLEALAHAGNTNGDKMNIGASVRELRDSLNAINKEVTEPEVVEEEEEEEEPGETGETNPEEEEEL